MNKKIIFTLLLVGIMSFMLSSCGSQGSGAGEGNTVVISAQTQNGQSTAVFASVGSPPFTWDTLDFTVTSTPYPGVSGIQASPVQITEERISFTPLPDSNGSPSPPLPSFSLFSSGTLPGGGTLDMNFGIVGPLVKQYLYNNYLTELTNNAGLQYSYRVNVVFIGVEINTGTSLSCTAFANAFISL